MPQMLHKLITPRLAIAILVIAVVGALGSYFLAASHAQAPPKTGQNASTAPLKPYSLGTAPYQYVAYSGSVDSTRAATGIKQYFAAFIISAGGCTPAWGGSTATGLTSQRSAEIAADFTKLRAAGGQVAVSFGGSAGTEMASSCQSVPELAAAYQSVIDTYGLKRVDFDIEGPALADSAGNVRRSEAIKLLQKSNPDLKIWITLPVHSKGLTPDGVAVLKGLKDKSVVVYGVNIMAMNYNINSKDMGRQAIMAAREAHGQMLELYPGMNDADIWRGMGITVMVGHNNTVPETFTLEDAAEVRKFAVRQGVGLLSTWNAGRDIACPEGTDTVQPSISCSGVAQQPFDFLKALTIPARP